MTIGRLTFLRLPAPNLVFGLLLVLVFRAQPGQVSLEKEFVIQNWDTEEGLPGSTVTCLAKTPDGYLWIGTPNGLLRYDGYRFRTFYPGNTPALSDASVTALLADHTGVLWVGTQNGSLIKVSSGFFTNVTPAAGFGTAQVNSLAEDTNGAIWGTLDRVGVFRYENGQFTFYGTNSGLPWQIVWGITVDTAGTVWVVSRGQLMRFKDERWEKAPALQPDFPRVLAVAPARDGGLWLACVAHPGPPAGDRGTRIYRLKGGSVAEDNLPVPWSQDSRRSLTRLLIEDRHGRLWCATRGAGTFVRDKTGWRLLSQPGTLSQVQALAIAEDELGSIWLGMDGAGLFRVRPKLVIGLEPLTGSPAGCFWTVHVGRDGNIWGGTDGNGIYLWKNGQMTRFGRSNGLTNEHVNAIIEDKTGRVWVGTMGGLFMSTGSRFEPVRGVTALELPVFSLKEDRSGNIWIGTRNGLVKLGLSETNFFGEDRGIPFGAINAIEEDGNGRIWVSVPPARDPRAPGPVAPHGLFVNLGDKFEHVGAGQWAGESSIRCLYADAMGQLWIGTVGAGVYLYRDSKFVEISCEDGLPHNRIQAIVPDDMGNLWFCSESGVFGAPLARLLEHKPGRRAPLTWYRVRRSDGLPNNAATGNGCPSAVRAPDGLIWFANGNAIAGFDPKSVMLATQIWPPIVDDVVVNGVQLFPNPRVPLRIGPSLRKVEIYYTSPNIIAPDARSFWIRLKGLDKEWIYAGAQRVMSYNLQPGLYEFEVAVATPDGTRLTSSNPLQIEVIPTFWERTSFRIVVGAALAGTIALGAWRWERARSDRRVRQLEIQRAMDMVRQRIARDIHDELGSGLTEIALLCDNLSADCNDPALTRRTGQRIAKRARALTRQIDEVVWAINPRTDTLESLVTYLNEYAQEQLTAAGIRCRLNTAQELPNIELPTDVRHNVFRAAKEALNNSIKHAHATEVAITIESRGKNLLVMIQDNGCGFDAQGEFTRGNGLRNIRQRLEEIGGASTIQSAIGSGTCVCLTIRIQADRAGPNKKPAVA